MPDRKASKPIRAKGSPVGQWVRPAGSRLPFEILPQPDDATCGPTCLQAIYNYYGDEQPLGKLISEVKGVQGGGTLAVFLGCHALKCGYTASIYTYNLQVFDPTWFDSPPADLSEKLTAQMNAKPHPKLRTATYGYLEFLRLGGRILLEDLTPKLIRKYLTRQVPILTGLSATYLYRDVREFGLDNREDDIQGEPVGHFVVLYDYDRENREVLVADPLHPNRLADSHFYAVEVERALGAILLGILTYDANLLIIERKENSRKK